MTLSQSVVNFSMCKTTSKRLYSISMATTLALLVTLFNVTFTTVPVDTTIELSPVTISAEDCESDTQVEESYAVIIEESTVTIY